MKILVDSAFPVTLVESPNPEGVIMERVSGQFDDIELLSFAEQTGYAALVLSEPEVLAQRRFNEALRTSGVAVICSTAEDPVEAETNMRHALPSIVAHLQEGRRGCLYWLGRSGLRAATEAQNPTQ